MSDLEDTERTIRRERRERITLMTHSLLTAQYQDRYYRVGIRQLMNRLLVMIQDHAVVVVLDKEDNDDDYRVIFHTMHDPLWKEYFEKVLCSQIINGDQDEVKGKTVKDYIYWDKSHKDGDTVWKIYESAPSKGKEFSTKYLAFFRIDFSCEEDKPHCPPEFELFDKHRIQDLQIGDFLKEFNRKDSALNNLYSSEKLDGKFDRRASKWENGSYLIPDCQFDQEYGNFLEDSYEAWKTTIDGSDTRFDRKGWPENFYDYHFEKLRKLFEYQYERIKDSPLLKTEYSLATNIIFTVRIFSENNKRYYNQNFGNQACYDYNVRTIIPKNQKDDIRAAFKNLKKDEIENDRRFAFGDDENVSDDFFWENIKTDEGIDEIFEVIESPFGEYSRALSDASLSGGFVRITNQPYSNKGIHKLNQSEWNKAQTLERKGKKHKDFRRLCYHHYMLYTMAPRTTKTSALVVPGHIGGSPWYTMAFLFDRNKSDHMKWQDGYHYYHSISIYLTTSLRRALKKQYLEEIYELIKKLTYYINNKYRIDQESYSIWNSILCHRFNAGCDILSRIYPFPKVLISTNFEDCANDKKSKSYDAYPFLEDHEFWVRTTENNYFLRNTVIDKGETFLHAREIIPVLISGHRDGYLSPDTAKL